MPPPRAESTEEEESILLDTAKGIAQFGIGIPRGVVNLGEGVGVGLATLLPEEQELAVRDYLKRQAESAREAITPEFYDPEDISSKVGEVLGGTIPFFPAGAAGMAAGRALAARLGASELAGATVGGAAGAATLGSPAGTAEAVERARAMGVPEDEMTGIALAGAGTGFLEGALPLAMGRLSRLVTDPKIRAALDKLTPQELDSVRQNLGTFAANTAKSFGIEGTQEGITAALQNVIAQSYDPEQEVIDLGVLEEAALGGTAGAIISATADVLLPGRSRGRTAPYDPKDFQDTVLGSAYFDLDSGTTAMTTPEIGEQLQAIGIEPELGRALTLEEIYALEKAGVAPAPVQEIPSEALTPEEEQSILQQLEEAGFDLGEETLPITPVSFTPPAASTPAAEPAVEPVVEPTDQEVEAQLRAAALEEEAQAQAAEEPLVEEPVEPAPEAPVAEAPATEVPILDDALFDALTVPKAAQVRKKFTGRPANDPEALAALQKYAANPQANPERRAKVSEFLASLEGAPSEPVAAVLEPDAEPRTDVAEPEPIADRVGPADGGPEPVVGRGDGVSDVGVEPEGGPAVTEAPEPGPVEGAGVPTAELVGGDGTQPSALEVEPAPEEAPAVEAEAEAPARTPETDVQQITQLQEADAETLSPAEAALLAYVPAGSSLDGTTIETIAYDAVSQYEEAPQGGMAAVAAMQWIRRNGSAEANEQLTKGLNKAQRILRGGQSGPQRAATTKLVKALSDEAFDPTTIVSRVKKVRELNNLPQALKSPVPDTVKRALRANNLAEAVRMLIDPTQVIKQRVTKGGSRTVVETTVSDTYRALAAPMLDYVGDVQVEVVQGLTDDAGNPIAGAYDAENNRILIDSRRGMNAHTLLHELNHAVTEKAIREGKLPAVKRLQKIFDELQPRLGDFYAGTSLREFISEVRSNPRLRTELASLTSKARVHPFRRILNELANIIRTVVGKPTKTEAELATPLDKMIFSIMEPIGSDAEAFNALYGADKQEQDKYMDRLVAQYFEGGKKLTKDEGDGLVASFLSKFGRAQQAVISDALSFASSMQLSDILGFFGPRLGQLGRDLNNELELQNGAMRNVMSRVDAEYRRMMNWRKNNQSKTRSFDQVVMIATIGQVDPTKPRDDYREDADKLFAYDRMKPIWERLGADGQEQWKRLRKTYQDMFANLKDVLFNNIDRYVEDPTTAKNLKKQVFEELFGKAELDVYFPLARQGDYWLTYNINGERVVEAFNSQAERRAAMAEIREAGGTMVTAHGAPTASNIANGAPTGSFVDRTLEILKAGRVSQNVQDQVVELFINALPETSLIRSMQKRKNRLGAIEDASVAFKQKGYSLARETLRIKHGNQLRSIQNQIDAEIDSRAKLLTSTRVALAEAEERLQRQPGKKNENARNRARKRFEEQLRRFGDKEMSNAMAGALKDEVGQRISFALNPPTGAATVLSRVLNRLTFVSFMGFNPASAIVQTGQIPLVNYWATAARTDNATAGQAYATGLSFFGSSGFLRQESVYDSEGNLVGTEERLGTNPSIDNYYVADDRGQLRIRRDLPFEEMDAPYGTFTLPNGDRREVTYKEFLELMLPMVQLASDRGQLGHSAIFEQLEINDVWKSTKSVGDVVTGAAGIMFHNAEVFGRQITLTANYLNELHRINTKPTAEERGMSPEERQAYAANEAIYLTQQTNGGSALITAPRMAQGKGRLGAFGRTMMMFKTYGLGMWYHQIKSARQALNNIEDPQVRKAAAKQLAGMTVASVALTGLQGFALTGSILAMLDLFLFDDDEMPAEIQAEDFFTPTAWNGAINYATGMLGGELDISQRMGFSNLIIANSRYAERDRDLYGMVGAALLGPSGSLLSNWVKSYQAFMEGDYQRGLELGLPTAMANIMRAERYASEGDKTRLGSEIISDYTDMEIHGKRFGFSSSRRSRQQYRLGELKRREVELTQQASRLRQRRNIAQNAGDYAEVKRIGLEIYEFNRRYPQYRISTETLDKSREQFRAGKSKEVGGVRYTNDATRAEARQIAEEQRLKRQQTE
jgi:hypothetical protein